MGGGNMSTNDFVACVQDMDTDANGKIDYQEFVSWVFKAPNLDQYFKIQEEYTQKRADLTAACNKELLPELTGGGNKTPEEKKVILQKYSDLQENIKADRDKELEPFIHRTFHWHDKKGNGILEKDESIIFFSNVAERLVKYQETSMVVDIVTDIISTVQQRQLDCTGSPDDMKEATQQIGDWKAAIKIVLAKKRQSFFKNMDERLKNAFEVVDVNKDGFLREEE